MTCPNLYRKSTAKAFISASETVAANSDLTFNLFDITGCAIKQNGNAGLTICKAGLYQVSFSGIAVESGTAGNIIVQLQNNGVNVPEAISEAVSSTDTDIESLNFTTILEVKGSCSCIDNSAVLTVENTGVGATFSNAVLTVIKLC